MKKYISIFSILFFILTSAALAQNQAPVISNLSVWQDDNNNLLHVYFDVADNEVEDLEIYLGVSVDGIVYSVDVSSATGDVGFPIVPGTTKEIVWDYGTAHPNISTYRVRVTADDRFQMDIQAIVDQVDTMNLYNDLTWMSGVRSHQAGFPHLVTVRDSIINRFNKLNLEVTTQAFSSFDGDTTGLNIYGRKPGVLADHQTFINDAHYDGVSSGPAADDNGSGVVGFMEVARILTAYNFKKSIRFIGFDMEETQPGTFPLGLVGSIKYLSEGGIQSWEEIEGVFNFEMIGYYSEKPNSQQMPAPFVFLFPDAVDSLAAHNDAGDFITNVGCDSSAWLAAQYDSITRLFVPDLRILTLLSTGNGAGVGDLRRSDHAPFWDQDIDALLLTDGANFRNLNYHLSTDVLDSLNFEFMGNNVKAVVASLCVLAEIQHSDVKYTHVDPALGAPEIGLAAPELHIYPNPTSDQVLIKISGDETYDSYEVEITDEAGRLIVKQSTSLAGEGLVLDVSSWKAGVYLVSVISGENAIVKSLIVQ